MFSLSWGSERSMNYVLGDDSWIFHVKKKTVFLIHIIIQHDAGAVKHV